MTRTRHISGSGNLARLVAIPVSVLFLAFSVTWLLVGELNFPNALLAVVFGVGSIVFLVRSPKWGIRVGGSQVTLSSWFRTFSVPIASAGECVTAPYSGLLNAGNIDGSGRWLKVVGVMNLTSARIVAPRGTITLARSAERQMNELAEELSRVQASRAK